jgi:hypothetical protein
MFSTDSFQTFQVMQLIPHQGAKLSSTSLDFYSDDIKKNTDYLVFNYIRPGTESYDFKFLVFL